MKYFCSASIQQSQVNEISSRFGIIFNMFQHEFFDNPWIARRRMWFMLFKFIWTLEGSCQWMICFTNIYSVRFEGDLIKKHIVPKKDADYEKPIFFFRIAYFRTAYGMNKLFKIISFEVNEFWLASTGLNKLLDFFCCIKSGPGENKTMVNSSV